MRGLGGSLLDLAMPDQHPHGHRDHHQVLGQRNEPQRHIAVTTDTGTFEFAFVDIYRFEHRHRTNRRDKQRNRYRKPGQRARDHQHTCQTFGKGIDRAIGYPSFGKQIVIEEHRREFLNILKFQQRQYDHRKRNEPFSGTYCQKLPSHRVAGGQRRRRCHAEQHNNRSVAGRAGLGDGLAEEAAQIVISAYPLTADKCLRCGFDLVFGFECVGFFARRQMVILDLISLSAKQVFGLQSVGAGMVGHDHAIKCCGAGGLVCHDVFSFGSECRTLYSFRTIVRSQAMNDMTIGRLAQTGGVGVETVRFYQRRGLLPVPPRSGSGINGGIRRYGPDETQRLRFIKAAQSAGFSLEEIKRLLDLDASADRAQVRVLARERISALDARIAELQRAKKALSHLADACSAGNKGPCPIIASFEAVAAR